MLKIIKASIKVPRHKKSVTKLESLLKKLALQVRRRLLRSIKREHCPLANKTIRVVLRLAKFNRKRSDIKHCHQLSGRDLVLFWFQVDKATFVHQVLYPLRYVDTNKLRLVKSMSIEARQFSQLLPFPKMRTLLDPAEVEKTVDRVKDQIVDTFPLDASNYCFFPLDPINEAVLNGDTVDLSQDSAENSDKNAKGVKTEGRRNRKPLRVIRKNIDWGDIKIAGARWRQTKIYEFFKPVDVHRVPSQSSYI